MWILRLQAADYIIGWSNARYALIYSLLGYVHLSTSSWYNSCMYLIVAKAKLQVPSLCSNISFLRNHYERNPLRDKLEV